MAATARARAPRGTARARAPARGRAGKGGIRWDRLGRVSLLVVLALVLLSYIGPAREYLRARSLSTDTRAEVQQLQQDNARLRGRAKQLQDLGTVELEARRSGMARPGERVYVIRDLPKDR